MKRILKEFELTRIAAVDRPCQEGAVMTIMKSESDFDRVVDAIVKRLTVLPVDDEFDDGYDDFLKAYVDVLEAMQDCEARDVLCPLFKALEDTFVEIQIDGDMETATKHTEMRTAVEAFMQEIAKVHPTAPTELNKALAVMERTLALQDRLVKAADKLKAAKAGKTGAKMFKTWTDEARQAAMAARHGHMAEAGRHTKLGNKYFASLHRKAASAYSNAIVSPSPEAAVELHRHAEDMGGDAYRTSRAGVAHHISGNLVHKAWSDEARQASAASRKGHHKGWVEAHGVRGMQSKSWRGVFKSPEHLTSWAEKNGAEIHATLDAEPDARIGLIKSDVSKAWSEEARNASAAARAKDAHGWSRKMGQTARQHRTAGKHEVADRYHRAADSYRSSSKLFAGGDHLKGEMMYRSGAHHEQVAGRLADLHARGGSVKKRLSRVGERYDLLKNWLERQSGKHHTSSPMQRGRGKNTDYAAESRKLSGQKNITA